MRAYDAGSGRLLWQHRQDEAAGLERATRIVARSRLVVASGTIQNAAGDFDSLVSALDPATGALRWEDRRNEANDFDEAIGVAIARGRAFAAGSFVHGADDRDIVVRSYDVR